MIVVADTSSLLNLAAVHRVSLLRELYTEILIPSAVCEELIRNGFSRFEPWMVMREVVNQQDLYRLRQQLDPGESEAIALATELTASLVLLDEKRGRRVARERGLEVTGLLGILAEAKTQGLIEACAPILDQIIAEAGFWVGGGLRLKFLKGVGEGA